MKLIDYIRSLLRTCPLLENERINVDFLDAENGSYSVNTSPAAPIVKRFIDGSSIRQYVFTFSSAELYGEEIRQNLENAGFWEDFTEWIESVAKYCLPSSSLNSEGHMHAQDGSPERK